MVEPTPLRPKRPTLDDVQEFYRGLYYSDPGGGKTTAIAAAARLGRVVYIDADGGLKPKALRRHDIPTGNIEPVPDTSYAGLIALHQELLIRLADGEEIFALAWDTASKSQEAFLDEVMPRSLEKSERKARRQSVEYERSEFEVYLEDRGEVVEMMKKLLRRFHGLPCHLLIGAHQRRDVDDETSKVTIGPGLSPSVSASFGGWMDFIIHCRSELFEGDASLAEWEGMEFMGVTRPDGRFVAKDRFGILPMRMINPSFDRVVGYLDGNIVRNKDELQNAAIARRKGRKAAVADADKDEPKADVEEEKGA